VQDLKLQIWTEIERNSPQGMEMMFGSKKSGIRGGMNKFANIRGVYAG
jgi:hypothetical protein